MNCRKTKGFMSELHQILVKANRTVIAIKKYAGYEIGNKMDESKGRVINMKLEKIYLSTKVKNHKSM
jgi:hypothetical protein